MIIDFNRYNGGGGSGSGVTPEQVQQQIDSALTPYWDSAATEDAISAATSGKADAANVSGRSTGYYFPYYNEQGVITGDTQAYKASLTIHLSDGSTSSANLFKDNNYGIPGIYVASKPGTAGQIAKSDGHGFTWADDIYTPTSGFSTINGSAITNGGNIVIQGGGDMSGFWNSAETKDYVDGRIDGYDSAVTLQYIGSDDLFRINGFVNCGAGNVSFSVLGNMLATTNVEPYMLKPIPQDPELGTINYVTVGFLYETDNIGQPTGVYYGFQNNGVFVEGEPVQLVRGNVEPSTQYTTPQGRGDGYFIIDSDNYTITWSAQPVVPLHIDGVYDAIDVLDADIQELSARTIPDMSLYTPTSGFSTINGSAITNGGNIVIQGGGGDMSGYWNSAETKTYVDSAVTELQDQVDTMDEVASQALVDINDRVDAISAATQDMVTSTDIKHIVKCTQAEYDDPSFIWDPETLYIIVNNSN